MSDANLPEKIMPGGLPIASLGLPDFIGARYEVDPILHQVWPDGQHANDARISFYDPEDIVREKLRAIAPTLAWVSFYAQAIVEIKHQTASIPDMLGNTSSSESLQGKRFEVAARQYVVERNEDGLVFLNEAQIMEEGKLRPAMEAWLGAIVGRGRFSSNEIEPFVHLL